MVVGWGGRGFEREMKMLKGGEKGRGGEVEGGKVGGMGEEGGEKKV